MFNKRYEKITFIDSLKILPFSVEEIAKSFGLQISKLTLDYNKPRSRYHQLTKEEQGYIKNDVLIVAQALKTLFDENLTKMTQGSNALNNYKEIVGKRQFEYNFPLLEPDVDAQIRLSYRGGFTYLSPEFKEKEIGKGCVLDVNSLYPSVMYFEKLPYGNPIYFEGEYKSDWIYDLYVQNFSCAFEIKPNKIPTIQIKNNSSYFCKTEYLTSSKNPYGHLDIVNLTLTSVDLKLFFEQYNIYDLTFHDGWKFKSKTGMFKEYIDKWVKVKNEGTKTGNKGQRTRAKLMLNSLYGKLATSLKTKSKTPFLGEDDIVHYKITKEKEKRGVYLPTGSFITAYARNKTIRTSQAIMDYSIKKYGKNLYVYSDTDSIHCLLSLEELKQFCEIDDVELGKWACEGQFDKARFLRQKTYIEQFR